MSIAVNLQSRGKNLHAKIVAGYTDIGYDEKYHPQKFPYFISTIAVSELQRIWWTDNGLSIGASAPITTVMKEIRNGMDTIPPEKMQLIKALLTQLRFFANNQVRNVASLGGGLVTASYLSDIVPVIVALNATLELRAHGDCVRFVQATSFFKNALSDIRPEETLVAIHIPFSRSKEYADAFKQARYYF